VRVCQRCRAIYSIASERCWIDDALIVEQPADPFVGGHLDSYQVISMLGAGGMGSVYRARHALFAGDCALKVLFGNVAANQRLVERFRREAAAISEMSHPNIVSIMDVGRTAAGLTYSVMELVEGRTLERVIYTEAPLEVARAARIAKQIASGLSEAHRRGFVHRDLKPANIMISKEGGFELVKILDFGVVGRLYRTASGLTESAHIVGTPSYMAPEQARASHVSAGADLYALGCIFYEMLSGAPPFEGFDIHELLLKHKHDVPAVLSAHDGLGRLVMQLLEKDPKDRPASAERVVEMIDNFDFRTASRERLLASRAPVDRNATPIRCDWLELEDRDGTFEPPQLGENDPTPIEEHATVMSTLETVRSRLPSDA
jgi:eukaryotic-like serine/threonine-protein kinase